MTPIVVLTVICVAGVAFLLRFLVALCQETRRRGANVEVVFSSDRNFQHVGGSVLDFEKVVRRRSRLIAKGRSQRAVAGQD